MSSSPNQKRYTIHVYQNVDGQWVKQDNRSYETDLEDRARKYVSDVNAVPGWKATLNGQETKEDKFLPAAVAAIDSLRQVLESGGPYTLSHHYKLKPVIEELATSKDPKALPALVALQDVPELPKDGMGSAVTIRVQIATALASRSEPAALDALVMAMSHKNDLVRRAAATALSTKGAAAIPAFVQSLRDRSNIVRVKALHNLNKLRWKPNTPQERALVALTERKWKAAIAEGLAVEEILIEALQFDDSAEMGLREETYYDVDRFGMGITSCTAEQAALALGELGSKRAIEPLMKCMQDSDTQVRKAAVLALQKLGINPDE